LLYQGETINSGEFKNSLPLPTPTPDVNSNAYQHEVHASATSHPPLAASWMQTMVHILAIAQRKSKQIIRNRKLLAYTLLVLLSFKFFIFLFTDINIADSSVPNVSVFYCNWPNPQRSEFCSTVLPSRPPSVLSLATYPHSLLFHPHPPFFFPSSQCR